MDMTMGQGSGEPTTQPQKRPKLGAQVSDKPVKRKLRFDKSASPVAHKDGAKRHKGECKCSVCALVQWCATLSLYGTPTASFSTTVVSRQNTSS